MTHQHSNPASQCRACKASSPSAQLGLAFTAPASRVARQRARVDRDYTGEWLALIEARPFIALRVASIALRMHAAKPTGKLYANAVWVRYGEEFAVALDHNLRAPAARWLMAEHPALAGRFVTRGDAGQVKERAR